MPPFPVRRTTCAREGRWKTKVDQAAAQSIENQKSKIKYSWEIDLPDMPRGVNISFRVSAANSTMTSTPSNTVDVVL